MKIRNSPPLCQGLAQISLLLLPGGYVPTGTVLCEGKEVFTLESTRLLPGLTDLPHSSIH